MKQLAIIFLTLILCVTTFAQKNKQTRKKASLLDKKFIKIERDQ